MKKNWYAKFDPEKKKYRIETETGRIIKWVPCWPPALHEIATKENRIIIIA